MRRCEHELLLQATPPCRVCLHTRLPTAPLPTTTARPHSSPPPPPTPVSRSLSTSTSTTTSPSHCGACTLFSGPPPPKLDDGQGGDDVHDQRWSNERRGGKTILTGARDGSKESEERSCNTPPRRTSCFAWLVWAQALIHLSVLSKGVRRFLGRCRAKGCDLIEEGA